MTGISETQTPKLECPRCGADVARMKASHSDESGANRRELLCRNGHRIVVERHLTYEEGDRAD